MNTSYDNGAVPVVMMLCESIFGMMHVAYFASWHSISKSIFMINVLDNYKSKALNVFMVQCETTVHSNANYHKYH